MTASEPETESTPRKIRLLIVDDHEVVRIGLRTALGIEPDLDVVGEAASGEEALALAARLQPNVVLLDVVMPGLGGVAACRELRTVWPSGKVLMLTSYTDDDAVLSSVLAGAAGYLLKNASRADLLRAIRTVAAGEVLLDPAVTAKVTARLAQLSQKPAAPAAEDTLSEREREVLILVARGYTNKEIAEALVISEKTARNHISHILEKLNVGRRSEAAAYAARKGLVPEED